MRLAAVDVRSRFDRCADRDADGGAVGKPDAAGVLHLPAERGVVGGERAERESRALEDDEPDAVVRPRGDELGEHVLRRLQARLPRANGCDMLDEISKREDDVDAFAARAATTASPRCGRASATISSATASSRRTKGGKIRPDAPRLHRRNRRRRADRHRRPAAALPPQPERECRHGQLARSEPRDQRIA